jgi:hypothetical protein
MRNIRTAAAVVVILAISVTAGLTAPAPPFASTVADAGAYDLTCTLIDLGTNTYQWELDYLGTSLPQSPDGEYMASFVVYDDVANYVGAGATAEIWNTGTLSWDSLADWDTTNPGIPSAAIEWTDNVPSAMSRIQPVESLRFTAAFTGLLDDCSLTAIHVRQLGEDGEDSEWVNNTPELAPGALMGLTMLPLGLSYLRNRRRKG